MPIYSVSAFVQVCVCTEVEADSEYTAKAIAAEREMGFHATVSSEWRIEEVDTDLPLDAEREGGT